MTGNAFTIAAAKTRDIGEIADLFRAYEAHIGVDLSYQGFADELATLPGKYAPPRGQLLIARGADGTAIGCVALRPIEAPGCCEMKRLYVSPTARGTGLGQALAETLIATAERIGYREMRLDSLASMIGAQALYRKLGFETVAAYYDTPVPGTTFMRRVLPVR